MTSPQDDKLGLEDNEIKCKVVLLGKSGVGNSRNL